MAIFSFNDIVQMDSFSIEKVLRETDCNKFVKALQLANTKVRDKIFAKLPDRISEKLKDKVESSYFYSMESKECQAKIVSTIARLHRNREIVLHGEVSFPSQSAGNAETDEDKEAKRKKRIANIIAEIKKRCKDKNHHLDVSYMLEDELRGVFEDLRNDRNDFSWIRSVDVIGHSLPIIAQFLETDKIEKLCVRYIRQEHWPYLGKFRCLKSLETVQAKLIPENIGDLQSLTELSIGCAYDCQALLPESIGNLKNLTSLKIHLGWRIERLPDTIGNLQSLTELSLRGSEKLKKLPDSIVNLRNLTHLDIRNSASVKHLPDGIERLASLKYVDLRGTGISSVPPTISRVEKFLESKRFWTISQGKSLSYRDFVNGYYTLAEALIYFNEKGNTEGLLALEDDVEDMLERKDFLLTGMRLMFDGTDETIIRQILTRQTEREHDFYRKKLMLIAIEGVLAIWRGYNANFIYAKLSSMVHIKDNPVEAAWKKRLSGDETAFDNMDFKSAMLPEGEREEVLFIKRALFLGELARKEGILAIHEHLDKDAIAARDPLEYGLSVVMDIWLMDLDYREVIGDIITKQIDGAPDPVQRNIVTAKKDAVMWILDDLNVRLLKMKLLAYFDEDIVQAFADEDEDC